MSAGVRTRLLGSAPVAHGWTLLRFEAPALAAVAAPGQQLAITFDTGEYRLPVSHVSADTQWLAVLAPPDAGLPALTPHQPATVALIGEALAPPSAPVLLVGSHAGIAAVLFLADRMEAPPRAVLLGAPYPPPFRPAPSTILTPGLPAHVIAAAPRLEAVGVVSRIASEEGLPGCYEGSVAELLQLWLAANGPMPVVACAPSAALAEIAGSAGNLLRQGVALD